MEESSNLERKDHRIPHELWVVAGPLVKSKASRLAIRLDLRLHEREDIEQELWLELLTRRRLTGPRGRDGGASESHADRCAHEQPSAARAQLQREIEQIEAGLTRTLAFWRRIAPRRERLVSLLWAGQWLADPRDAAQRQDLRLDVAALLAELPAADRRLCYSLMNDEAAAGASANSDTFVGADHERRIAALRSDFAALGLHEYLFCSTEADV
jgi:hypothetical protein